MPSVDLLATVIFALALLHTFSVKWFQQLAHRHVRHAGLLHLLGEIEVVFGFWAVVLVATMAALHGGAQAIAYAESRQYTEPLFVFVIMVVAASRPVVHAVQMLVAGLAALAPGRDAVNHVWSCLALVPLLGSLVTEPAAMTLAALMLAPRVFRPGMPEWLKYGTLGVLFVNISIGGTLTSFAAPPVLMVAAAWQWDSAYMASHFGGKAAVAILVNASVMTALLRRHLVEEAAPGGAAGIAHHAVAATAAKACGAITTTDAVGAPGDAPPSDRMPTTVILIHLAFLAGVVTFAHHPVIFLGLFLMFLGYTQAYERHQSPLIIKEALLVAFFLAGLVVLGGLQQWWLQPIVASLAPTALFFGALGLTAITDNAALTYLGAQIEGLADAAKYMLVAGAVAGGGLTVIANAPNPAGVALLRKGFADESIGTIGLLLGALAPTAVAAAMLLI